MQGSGSTSTGERTFKRQPRVGRYHHGLSSVAAGMRRTNSARMLGDDGNNTARRVASARAAAVSGPAAGRNPKRRSSIGATAGPRVKPSPTPPTDAKVDLVKLEEELAAELLDLSVPRLRKRATDDGVETFDIVAAEGQEDPKSALTILVIEHAKSIAKSGGRTRQPGAGQPSAVSKALRGAAEALKETPKPKGGYEGLEQNSSVREAERRYVPTNEGPAMRMSPAEARRQAAAGGTDVDAGALARGKTAPLPHATMSKDSAASAAESSTTVDETTSASDSEPCSPSYGVAPSDRAPPEGALARSRRVREELESLKFSALRKRLHACGVDEAKAEAAEDADDPKSAMIELIIEKELDDAGAL